MLAGLGAGIWLATGTSRNGGPEPVQTVARTRALSPVSACLLTDAGGVMRAPASAVWAGVQAAAAAQLVRASYLPVLQGRSAASMLNTLLAQRCSVIAGVGPGQVAAVDKAAAGRHPGVRFAAAGTATAGPVIGFPADRAGTRTAVEALLVTAKGVK